MLLAAPNRPNSLYYGLGLDRDRDPFDVDSAPSAAIAELCERFVGGFGPGERAVFENARRRRNAELHSALAAMEGLDRGWRGRLFATCRVLLAHLKLSLTDLLGSEAGHLAERLVVEDAASVRKEVEATIESARKRFAKLPGAQRETRRQKAEAGLRFDPLGGGQPTTRPGPSRLLREVPCPACQTRVGLTGEVVTRNRPRVDAEGDLVQTEIAVPSLLDCPVCGLCLEGVAALTVRGLGDPVHLSEYPDPVETFGVDLDEYRDEFLQSLAEDSAYMDE